MRKTGHVRRPRGLGGEAVRRIGGALLCLAMCLGLAALPAVDVSAAVHIPTSEEMYKLTGQRYKDAIAFDKARYHRCAGSNYTWFSGGCAHLCNVQLLMLGINTKYVGANGCDEWDNYYKLKYSGGGYKIHAYSAKEYTVGSALEAIEKECPVATNIMMCFSKTMSSKGKTYGHSFFIHGLIDGNVYFTDNFTISYKGMYFESGDVVVMTLAQCQAYYGRSWFTFEGAIWFEDESLTTEVKKQGGYVPGNDDPGIATNAAKAGYYQVINASGGLNIRSGPDSGSASFGKIKNGEKLYVTGVSGDWGKVFYSNSEFAVDGWVSMKYLKYLSKMPAVLMDTYDSAGFHVARGAYASVEKAVEARWGDVTVITLQDDCVVTSPVTLDDGVTVDTGSHTLTVNGEVTLRGGTLISSGEIKALTDDPFVLCEKTKTQFIYQCYFGLRMKSAQLYIGDKVAMKFTTSFTCSMLPVGAEVDYKLVCTGVGGKGRTVYSPVSVEDDLIDFVTEGLAAKYMSDSITCRAEITVTYKGVSYLFTSGELSYSPVDYSGDAFGKDSRLDALLVAMLRYGSESQKFFGYSTDRLADRFLTSAPAATADELSEIAPRALTPPYSSSSTQIHVNSAKLAVGDTVHIVFGTSSGTLPEGTRLLGWTYADYRAVADAAGASGADAGASMTASNCSFSLAPDSSGSFATAGLSPLQFSDTYYFRLAVPDSSGNYAYDCVITFSVTSYCAYLLGNGLNDSADALCLAICRYGRAARDYLEAYN
jgi:hypothetical protein